MDVTRSLRELLLPPVSTTRHGADQVRVHSRYRRRPRLCVLLRCSIIQQPVRTRSHKLSPKRRQEVPRRQKKSLNNSRADASRAVGYLLCVPGLCGRVGEDLQERVTSGQDAEERRATQQRLHVVQPVNNV